MKNKMYVIALMVFGLGAIMLFGTSYSLIMNNLVSDESYGFDVANFDVSFNDNTEITISSIPMSDEEAIRNIKEYTFKIDNNSDYDINYRLDIVDLGSTNVKDVIHYVYSVNDSEYSDVYSLKDNYTITQNKILKVNASDIYKVKLWLSLDADESYMNKSFKTTILLTATQNEYKYASTVIEKLANEKKDNLIKVDNGYRYNTKEALNYVWFNCEDGFTKGDDYCEKWRIIGSFNNKSEKRDDEYPSLKIVATKVFENLAYNSDELNNFDEAYINTYLNGFYYDKLEADTQKLILTGRWNIGEVTSNNYEEALKEEKSVNYYANIGLPNISDYLYLQDESFFPINMMFLNKTNGNVNILGNGVKKVNNLNNYGVVPCLYLRGDVSIISGDGSIDSPYELAIKYPLNY